MKQALCLILALAAVPCLSACGQSAASSQPEQSSPADNTTTTIQVSTDTDQQLRQSVREYLQQTYSDDEIVGVRLQSTRVDAEVLCGYSQAGGQPDNWSDVRTQAETLSSGLTAMLPADGERSSAILYLVDAEDNNILVVQDGKITWDAFNTETIAVPADNPPTISLDEFNAIRTGMEYQEVFDIVGSRGTVLSEVDLGLGDEYYTATYSWDGEGSLGANANVTFQGGKVTSKAQFGLQ